MYFSYCTRPNTLFIVEQLSMFNADPSVGHFKLAKQVIQYLKVIIQERLIYKI